MDLWFLIVWRVHLNRISLVLLFKKIFLLFKEDLKIFRYAKFHESKQKGRTRQKWQRVGYLRSGCANVNKYSLLGSLFFLNTVFSSNDRKQTDSSSGNVNKYIRRKGLHQIISAVFYSDSPHRFSVNLYFFKHFTFPSFYKINSL